MVFLNKSVILVLIKMALILLIFLYRKGLGHNDLNRGGQLEAGFEYGYYLDWIL